MFDTPGVYVREIPSGSRPISGVATSNTAFVGPFERGPVNEAVRVTSYGEFERIFGGLFPRSDTSYAVRTYFLNGGSIAFIVRVADTVDFDLNEAADPLPIPGAAAATIPLPTNEVTEPLILGANSLGAWGNNIRVAVFREDEGATFNLLVREIQNNAIVREELFRDLSITVGQPRYVANVLNADSELVTVVDHNNGRLPDNTILETLPDPDPDPDVVVGDFDELSELVPNQMTPFVDGEDGVLPGGDIPTDWATRLGAVVVGSENDSTGIYALNQIVPDVFNILCLPDVAALPLESATQMTPVYEEAYRLCTRNFAFLLVDIPTDVDRDTVQQWAGALGGAGGPNSALYFPRIEGADPLDPLNLRAMPSSGVAAGHYARTDARRGVWKAPAGTDTRISGGNPVGTMTNRQQGPLNTNAINVLRTFPVYNSIIWGARTLDGADARASEWRYVPVRRLALFIESSLQRGLQWVVFEPNDEPLWSDIRMNVTAFMSQLHRKGAFQGSAQSDAFVVRCDSETTSQADINLGIVNILVGFAPVRPAEFVVLRIQQRINTAT